MRIAVTGTQCIGKTTFINDFLMRWPMYKKPEKTYRDLISEKNIRLNQEGTKESQETILDALCDQAENSKEEKHCIHDRCVIDNLAYTCWLAAKRKGGVTDSDVTAAILRARMALKHYDVIFFLPISTTSPIPIEAKENRDIDLDYRNEIDHFLKAFNVDYIQKKGKIFPTEDCPAVIEVFGDRSERLHLVSLYVNEQGNAYDEKERSLISFDGFTDEDELSELEKNEIMRCLSGPNS